MNKLKETKSCIDLLSLVLILSGFDIMRDPFQ